jgi:hypothetical protein
MARERVLTDAGSRPPTDELGAQVQVGGGLTVLSGKPAPWSTFIDENEYVPELQWPTSISTYDQMRTDSQLSGLFTAVMFGISQLRFLVDPNGAKPEIVQGISEDLNIPIKGKDAENRMKHRFAHTKHLQQALLAMAYGHMYFEQVGVIEGGLWRLRKLAPRMPQTIAKITVAEDGGLVSISQNIGVNNLRGMVPYGLPEIPVDRLTAFIFQQEGPSWVGRSMFRDCYRNWLIKDRLLRVDAINHERAGGVPIGVGAVGMTPGEVNELNEMMQGFRIGETSGGAVPAGADVKVVKGTGSDVVESIRMHDEAMARRFLLMVTSLAQGGTSIGSYSLGQVFADFFSIGQKAIVKWYCDVMNEHVIEDWVDWNYGPSEELAPVLTWEGEDEVLGIDALATLVKNKIVIVDEEIEDAMRYKFSLPRRTAPRPAPMAVDPTVQDPTAPDGGDAGGKGPGAPSQPTPPAEPSTKKGGD